MRLFGYPYNDLVICKDSPDYLGFRSGRSCLSALLDVYDDVMHMLNGDSIVDMVYLDFAKAFDKVDHGILLHKVKDFGITGKLGQCNCQSSTRAVRVL